jgi:hypothetical protein
VIIEANYQRYIQQFTSAKMANEYKDIYQSCIYKNSGRLNLL